MSNLFHVIDDQQAIIKMARTGVYKQVKLFERNEELYVAAAGGFVKLMNDNRTSHPLIKWETINVPYGRATALAGGLRLTKPSLRVVAG